MLLSGWQQRLPLQAGKPGRKWSSGRLCQLDSYSTSWWPVVGLPRWLFPWRHRQCISAKIEHNSNRCHGEMYFDIVLVYSTKGRKRPPPRPTTRQQQRRRGGGQVMQLFKPTLQKADAPSFGSKQSTHQRTWNQLKATLKLGSSSNRYAPRLPRRETKSSTKQLTPTDPILGPEKLLKPASLKRASLVLQSSWQRKSKLITLGFTSQFCPVRNLLPSFWWKGRYVLVVRGMMVNTNPNRTCKFVEPWWSGSVVPTIAMSRPCFFFPECARCSSEARSSCINV